MYLFNYLGVFFMCMCSVAFARSGVIKSDTNEQLFKSDEVPFDMELIPHLLDFVELLDIQKLMTVAMKYMGDPEVVSFAMFVTSPQFPKLVQEFESMEEFKEAVGFLELKGYNAKGLLDVINAALNLPPFQKPALLWKSKKGISGLLQDMVEALPVEDMKELFQNKLETNPEVAELFETINSKEFVHILKKMSQNPKFQEFKKTFESYGFDFEIICAGAKEIFGEHYQGIFCE